MFIIYFILVASSSGDDEDNDSSEEEEEEDKEKHLMDSSSYFEAAPAIQTTDISFTNMNLSRPLLKVSEHTVYVVILEKHKIHGFCCKLPECEILILEKMQWLSLLNLTINEN